MKGAKTTARSIVKKTTAHPGLRRLTQSLICCLLLAGTTAAQPFLFSEDLGAFAGLAKPIWASTNGAVADYDNDGWPDLLLLGDTFYALVGPTSEFRLLHNDGQGGFVDRTTAIRAEMPRGPKQAHFADYDNDGDLDIFIQTGFGIALASTRGSPRPNLLLRNDRGIFVDVTAEAGLVNTANTPQAAWFDYDRDGWLDLYIGNADCDTDIPPHDMLYRNLGDGTFVDVTEAAGLRLQQEDIDCGDGSNGGLSTADFDGDGWPDLYQGLSRSLLQNNEIEGIDPTAPNRLLLNNGDGRFRDATTRELADPGPASGAIVGDINNDGDMDLFQASGALSVVDPPNFRTAMYLNRGAGQLLDFTENLGLSRLVSSNIFFPALADLDNDGDLDLQASALEFDIGGSFRSITHFLFLNNGAGFFVDESAALGLDDVDGQKNIADYDRDGLLDMFEAGPGTLSGNRPGKMYRNTGMLQAADGNAEQHHWLQVELVGQQSNSYGVGARLVATTGALQQTRQLLSDPVKQSFVTHFGLGEQTQVDRLEIRWPSGQVDVLEDIAADQHIRIIEGQGRYHRIRPAAWVGTSALVQNEAVDFSAAVRPMLFDADAQIIRVTADLSALGLSADTPLQKQADGTYAFTTRLDGFAQTQIAPLSVLIEQQTSVGPHWSRIEKDLLVLPPGDLQIFAEGLAPDWQLVGDSRVQAIDLTSTDRVYEGRTALALQVDQNVPGWSVRWTLPAPLSTVGYTTLRFVLHPGDLQPPALARLRIALNGEELDLLEHIDIERKEWQIVEIPLATFALDEPITAIELSGTFGGLFYIDDLRLVALPLPPGPTAVLEVQTATLPQTFTLSQNFPNPFNSGTVIRFALPTSEHVRLTLYNLAGQKVATLADGLRQAGSYTINWDGKDDGGRVLASGIYLYKLQAGTQEGTRKLLLLR